MVQVCAVCPLVDGLVALTEGNWAMTNGTGPGTAGIFATYPAEYLTTQGGLIDQVSRPDDPPPASRYDDL